MFVATEDGSIWGFDDDGDALPGWPVTATAANTPGAMPALGDLDGDGTVEIVWAGSNHRLYAWNAAGRAMPGFPVELDGGTANGFVALADLDGKQGVELAVMSG